MRLPGHKRRPMGAALPEPDDPLAAALCGYARRLHGVVGDEHHIASPLGAWLLLALVAPVAHGPARAGLELALGMPAEAGAAAARELLSRPHPAVLSAAAAWRRADQTGDELDAWLRGLDEFARVGPMPTQAEADAWAAEHTLGLIERFPLEIDADTLLVLASALACKISWATPFQLVNAAELALPLAPGFDGLRRLLRDPGAARRQAIVDSPAGPLAVHAAESGDGDLVVVSVLAEPDVPAGEVLSQAHLVAHAIVARTELPAYSLFELPLGAGHAWTITEQAGRVLAPDGLEERYGTVLPAWSAESEHDLSVAPEFGFGDAAAVLAALLPPDPRGHVFAAKQVALARYTRTGFEAAAVTAIAMRAGGVSHYRDGLVRTAQLEFTRPFAVVAVPADGWHGDRSAWAGLPAFSAWVTAPDEAE